MTDDENSEDGEALKGTVPAIAELAKAVPMDALVIWGAEQYRRFAQRIEKKLDATPREHINRTPKASVVVPALEAVRLTESEVDLQEFYANLITRAMDKRVADGIFPSFVEILKQLTSDEAKLLKTFKDGMDKGELVVPIVHIQQEVFDDSGRRIGGLDVVKNRSLIGDQAECEYPNQVPSYLDNLARLGLIVFHAPGTGYADKSVYRELEADPEVEALRRQYEQPPRHRTKYVRTGLEVTTFGRHFINACVRPYESTHPSSDTAG